MNIPIFVPHKGCPFDCIYCNQKLISGQMEEMDEVKMRQIIESHLSTAGHDTHIEIGFFGGSFTGIEREQQIKFLEIANEYIRGGWVKGIRLSTRPDYINKEILNYLKEYRVQTIELGVQSLDDEVLAKSCRGHHAGHVVAASCEIKKHGFKLGIQTMVGLPGDTREKALETATKVVGLKPDAVRIYPTLVIKGTYLEKMYNQGLYLPLDIEEAVETCAELLGIYEADHINVIRIGLQPTDRISEGMDIVAGPFHPAFRQLVESRRLLHEMEKQILTNDLDEEKNIVILCSVKNISNVVGQKRENIKYLKQKFRFNTVKVKTDEKLDAQIRIEKKIEL